MNVSIPDGLKIRAGDLDFSDLAPGCAPGEASWEEDGHTLSIPFTPEPTAAQQQRIRRRLLTRNADEERIVAGLAAAYDSASGALKLLIEDRVARIEGWQR